jgi:hypothetical protein
MTLTIDEEHFQAAAKCATNLGMTPELFIQSLIEKATGSFDEICAPVRRGFESMTDDELDAQFDRATKWARSSS